MKVKEVSIGVNESFTMPLVLMNYSLRWILKSLPLHQLQQQRLQQLCAIRKNVEIKKARHELDFYLEHADTLVREVCDRPFSEEVKQTILEINNVDPKSQAFRYATSKKGDHFFSEQVFVKHKLISTWNTPVWNNQKNMHTHACQGCYKHFPLKLL